MALNAKQQVFLAAYLECWNASEAARQAGYSAHTARAQGSRLLTNVDIAAEVERFKAERIMSAEEVQVRLTEQGRAEYAAYIGSDGRVDLYGLIQAGKAHLIKKIKPTKYGNEIEFYDAQTALAQIAKAHGMNRVTLDGSVQVERKVTELSDSELEQYIRSRGGARTAE